MSNDPSDGVSQDTVPWEDCLRRMAIDLDVNEPTVLERVEIFLEPSKPVRLKTVMRG